MNNLPIQSQFRGYVIERSLGAGGMGAVYLARRGERQVAIKTMNITAAGPAELERFQREAQGLASVEAHPNFGRVHEFGLEPIPFIILEFVEGTPLNVWLKENGPLEPEQALELFTELANAVGFIHDQGLVHRDLKPQNIMMKRSESGHWTPVIIDFGLMTGSEFARLTMTGEILGTPVTMAPEQWRNESGATRPTVDIWALSVIHFYLLTGDYPIRATTPLLFEAALKKLDLTQLIAEFDPRSAEIIGRGLEFDWRRRVGTVRELLGGEVDVDNAAKKSRGLAVFIGAAVLLLLLCGAMFQHRRRQSLLQTEITQHSDILKAELIGFVEATMLRKLYVALNGHANAANTPLNADQTQSEALLLKSARWIAEHAGEVNDQTTRQLVRVFFEIEKFREKHKKQDIEQFLVAIDSKEFSESVAPSELIDSTRTMLKAALIKNYSMMVGEFVHWKGHLRQHESLPATGWNVDRLEAEVLIARCLVPWFRDCLTNPGELAKFKDSVVSNKLTQRFELWCEFNRQLEHAFQTDRLESVDINRFYESLIHLGFGVQLFWPRLRKSWLLRLFEKQKRLGLKRILHVSFLQSVIYWQFGDFPEKYEVLSTVINELRNRASSGSKRSSMWRRAALWLVYSGAMNSHLLPEHKHLLQKIKGGIEAGEKQWCAIAATQKLVLLFLENIHYQGYPEPDRLKFQAEICAVVRNYTELLARPEFPGHLHHVVKLQRLGLLYELLVGHIRRTESKSPMSPELQSQFQQDLVETLKILKTTPVQLPNYILAELAELRRENFLVVSELSSVKALVLWRSKTDGMGGVEESLKQAFTEVDALEKKLASDSELSVTAANLSILELKLRYHYLLVEYHVSVGTRESKVEALKHLTTYFKSTGSTHSPKLQLYFELRTDLGLEKDLDKGYKALELNVGRRATYEAEYSAWIKSKSKAK